MVWRDGLVFNNVCEGVCVCVLHALSKIGTHSGC